ncbi:MAG: class I SAM-dependent methyltransferase [Alphaproteobacteria bacterium]|nr:class I SAM-dependent methyltransferase [Alphaproteobacteria bacterium]
MAGLAHGGDPRLAARRAAWERKPALRAVYADYYRRMTDALPDGGVWLEIGAGSGHSTGLLDARLRMDILESPWIDVVGDAQRLPFADESLDGIALLDVLHHLGDPGRFFEEAARALKPGGRIVLLDPGITPLSWLFYHFLHEETVDMAADPLAPAANADDNDPFESNQAIPTLLFKREEHRIALSDRVPALKTVERRWLSLFAYPLTGGFKRWTLLPEAWVAPLLRLEDRLLPFLGMWAAWRLLVVLEKR